MTGSRQTPSILRRLFNVVLYGPTESPVPAERISGGDEPVLARETTWAIDEDGPRSLTGPSQGRLLPEKNRPISTVFQS